MPTITVGLDDGTVFCTPKAGNLRVGPGGTITWKSRGKGQKFRLTFYLEPFDGMPARTSEWPFTGTPPAAPSTGWVEDFTGTAGDDGVFKYLVEVMDASGSIVRLDPIIIIRN
jgi:hypothetical protein